MGLDAKPPVFGVSDKARLKPVCSATEASKNIEFSLVASLKNDTFKKRIIKALISLEAQLVISVLGENHVNRRRVRGALFSHR